MATTLTVAVNTSNNDVEYTDSGSTWAVIDTDNDYLIFSNGSTAVNDGEDIPTQSELQSAGMVLNGTQQIVDRYFLADVGSDILQEIFLMGNTTNRYVMAFSFDGATATEPVLELWDDSGLDTITSTTLGAGTPSSSWWKAICTTSSAPGSDWTGTSLAGSGSGYYLNLNNGNGALASADDLYCNLKVVIPATATSGISATPVFAVKFASN